MYFVIYDLEHYHLLLMKKASVVDQCFHQCYKSEENSCLFLRHAERRNVHEDWGQYIINLTKISFLLGGGGGQRGGESIDRRGFAILALDLVPKFDFCIKTLSKNLFQKI